MLIITETRTVDPVDQQMFSNQLNLKYLQTLLDQECEPRYDLNSTELGFYMFQNHDTHTEWEKMWIGNAKVERLPLSAVETAIQLDEEDLPF